LSLFRGAAPAGPDRGETVRRRPSKAGPISEDRPAGPVAAERTTSQADQQAGKGAGIGRRPSGGGAGGPSGGNVAQEEKRLVLRSIDADMRLDLARAPYLSDFIAPI